MSEFPQPHESDQLLELSQEVSRIAGTLARLSMSPAFPTHAPGESHDPEGATISEETVRWLIKARRARARYLSSELFADPVWDMLLDLLRAEIAQQRVSVSSLCIASGVPATTALRYINTMTEQELIVRRRDPFDGRRVYVELTPGVSKALRRYFAEVVQSPRAA
jgi:DNA-binding MarR family transcriptional regulator